MAVVFFKFPIELPSTSTRGKRLITTLYGIVHAGAESEKKAIKSGLCLGRSRPHQTGP